MLFEAMSDTDKLRWVGRRCRRPDATCKTGTGGARERAERMFDQIFNMKFLPPGRGLWAMGSELTESVDSPKYAALNNCAFVSTDSMHVPGASRSKPFTFLMDASMLGYACAAHSKK